MQADWKFLNEVVNILSRKIKRMASVNAELNEAGEDLTSILQFLIRK